MRLLFWTTFMIVAVLFMFSIAATELIGKNSKFLHDQVAQENFGNLPKSMFTMFQVMTLDTWADAVARPVMEKEPLLGIFFILYITLAVFVLMNLITAIIVENAFSIVEDDTEQQAKIVQRNKKAE